MMTRTPQRGFTTRSEVVLARTRVSTPSADGGKARRAFTLIETMIAITILITSIVGPFFAVQRALSASNQARDQLAATSLAQEAVEYVLGVRDNNFLYNLKNGGSRTMTYGLDSTFGTNCFAPNWCTIDPGQSAASICTSSGTTGCPSSSALYLANGTGGSYLYNQASTGSVSRYTRGLQLSNIVNANGNTEVQVKVLVSWQNHGPHSVIVTDVLDNWL